MLIIASLCLIYQKQLLYVRLRKWNNQWTGTSIWEQTTVHCRLTMRTKISTFVHFLPERQSRNNCSSFPFRKLLGKLQAHWNRECIIYLSMHPWLTKTKNLWANKVSGSILSKCGRGSKVIICDLHSFLFCDNNVNITQRDQTLKT